MERNQSHVCVKNVKKRSRFGVFVPQTQVMRPSAFWIVQTQTSRHHLQDSVALMKHQKRDRQVSKIPSSSSNQHLHTKIDFAVNWASLNTEQRCLNTRSTRLGGSPHAGANISSKTLEGILAEVCSSDAESRYLVWVPANGNKKHLLRRSDAPWFRPTTGRCSAWSHLRGNG